MMSTERRTDWTLLTGATGFVGGCLLAELLAAGERVAILVRPAEKSQARARHMLRTAGPELASHVVVLTGDVTDRKILERPHVYRWLETSCKRIVHAAASVSFSEDTAPTNVIGTANLLAFAKTIGVTEFHHVSSAYQCGVMPGEVVMERDVGNAKGLYRNKYEESKYLAECAVMATDHVNATIYRPSMIVGDRQTGATSCFRTLYRLIRFVATATEGGGSRALIPGLAVKVPLTGGEPVNIVPVDYVAKSIVKIVAQPICHGKTYHLNVQLTTRQVAEALAEYFDMRPIEFVPSEKCPLEEFLLSYLGEYASYFGTDPVFDTTNTDDAVGPCRLDETFLKNIIDYAVVTKFGRRRAPQPHKVA